MKTFIDLKLNDQVYYVGDGCTSIKSYKLKELSVTGIRTNVSNGGSGYITINTDEMQKSVVRKHGYHHVNILFFANHSTALEYAKRQAMAELNKLKEKAVEAINQVIDFRKNNYKELNHDWVQIEINSLKKLEKESL